MSYKNRETIKRRFSKEAKNSLTKALKESGFFFPCLHKEDSTPIGPFIPEEYKKKYQTSNSQGLQVGWIGRENFNGDDVYSLELVNLGDPDLEKYHRKARELAENLSEK